MMKLLVAIALVVTATGHAVAADAPPLTERPSASSDSIYSHFLRDHLSYPARLQAERFMARQEKLDHRPAPDSSLGYGRAGCKPDVTYEVGDQRTFFASQYDAGSNVEITAVLAAKSRHGYLWVQREFYIPASGTAPAGGFVTQSEAEEALVDWEAIYPQDRKYFGLEPHPDVVPKNLPPGLPRDWRDADCDPRVHILNFPIDAGSGHPGSFIAGYFSSEHEYPNGTGPGKSPYSNEAEMFFMNSLYLNVGSDQYSGVIAHEFFHMIQFSNDYNEETWINEGMADIAIIVCGYGNEVQGHINAYEEDPDKHLFDWTSELQDYGQAFLFLDYFFNHYGAPENPGTKRLEVYGLAKVLTRTLADGAKGITKVMKSRKARLLQEINPYYWAGGFKKVFKDWLVANFIDNENLAKGQFGYANRTVKVAGAGTSTSVDNASAFSYGGDYYEVTGEGGLNATVQDPVAVIPANEGQPPPANGFFAWSNRADELLSWLERRADLSKATSPQLKFKYWYQIEEDWDYAYVRVSADGGATYEFVNTSGCGGRATDPNGNNRAIAESGGITGDSDGWQDCTLDLAQYAGGPVLIRFEYDTDQAVTEPGFVADNVTLVDGDKTIWKTSKFETRRSSRAWTFQGSGLKKWMRIRPLAKNKPLLQVVRLSGSRVSRRVLTRRAFEPSGEGLRLARPTVVGGDQTIIIFSGLTPIALDPYTYSYSIR